MSVNHSIIKSIKGVERLLQLAEKYQLEYLEIDGIRLQRSRFATYSEKSVGSITLPKDAETDAEDEILYWSAS